MVAQETFDLTRAHARATDPQESWDAARSIPRESLSETRQQVLQIVELYGPCTAETVVRKFRVHYPLANCTDQRIRTALSDNAKQGYAHKIPGGQSSRGNSAALWVLGGGQET